MGGVEGTPFVDPLLPFSWHLTQNGDSCPYIFASFCVMRGRGQQGLGSFCQPRPVLLMKSFQADPELLRMPSHLIEGGESVKDVKGSILQSFGHDWARALLKLQDELELQPASSVVEFIEFLQEQNISEKIKNRCVDRRISPLGRPDCVQNDLSICLRNPGFRADVGAVNWKASDQFTDYRAQ